MKSAKRNLLFITSILLLGIGVMACNQLATPIPATKPIVRIVSPPQGARVSTGGDVQIMASAQDPSGVVRLELWVDGTLATTLQPPSPQTDYTALLPWTANSGGDHSLCVRAANKAGASTDSAPVTVRVMAGSSSNAVATITPGILPTVLVTPSTPTLSSAAATLTSPLPTVATSAAPAPATSVPPPADTATPQIAPGLYVTAITLDPPEPKSTPAQFVFHVTFLNSTGAPIQLPRWRVLIFRPDARKSMGDPRGINGTAEPGTSERITQPWQIKVIGCEPFYAKPVREGEGGGLTPILKPDGQELTVSFKVCS